MVRIPAMTQIFLSKIVICIKVNSFNVVSWNRVFVFIGTVSQMEVVALVNLMSRQSIKKLYVLLWKVRSLTLYHFLY